MITRPDAVDENPPVLANNGMMPYSAVPQEPEEEESAFDIREYLHVLWKRKWLILASTVILMVVGAVQLRNSTPIYTSKAIIKYEPYTNQIVNMQGIGTPVDLTDEIFTQVELIESPRITERVMTRLGYDSTSAQQQEEAAAARRVVEEPSPFRVLQNRIQDFKRRVHARVAPYKQVDLPTEVRRQQNTVAYFQNIVEVQRRPDTKLIEIIARHQDAHMASRVANAYAEEYIADMQERKTSSYENAILILDDRVQDAREDLELAVSELIEEEQALPVQGGEGAMETALEDLNARRQELNEKIREKDRYETYLNILNTDNPEAIEDFLLQELPSYAQLYAKLTEVRAQKALLGSVAVETHQDFSRLDTSIGFLQEEIAKAAKVLRQSLQTKLDVTNAEIGKIQERIKAQEELVTKLRPMLGELEQVKRDVTQQTMIYDTLLQRYKEVDVVSTLEKENVDIIQRAPVPTFPTYPRVDKVLMQHIMLGLVIGVLLALAIHKLDQSVRDPRAVEAKLGLPTLGMVPFLRTGKGVAEFMSKNRRRRIRLISSYDSFSSEAEAFKLLRTSLQYSTPGHSPKVILVTSCVPREGKSTVASNMAIVFGGRGEKTLLIDADLKLPILHQTFQLTRTPGLSDVLTGQVNWHDTIQPSGEPNVDIMPAGHGTPSPVDLLESDSMMQLLTELRKEYNTVIIDSAPLVGMSDTFVLGTKVDGVCIVVNMGSTRRELLQKAVAQLRAIHVRVLGVIYNYQSRGTKGLGSYYYYGGYRYGYGGARYGYGYNRFSGGEAGERQSSGSVAKLLPGGEQGKGTENEPAEPSKKG